MLGEPRVGGEPISTWRRGQAQGGARGTQAGVEGRERQIAALGELKIAGIVNAEAKPVREGKRGRPDMRVAFAINLDRQQSKIGEGLVAVALIDPLAPDRGLEAVRD